MGPPGAAVALLLVAPPADEGSGGLAVPLPEPVSRSTHNMRGMGSERMEEGRHMLLHVCDSMTELALTCAGCGSDDSRRGTRHMLKGSEGVILSRRRCCCWQRRGCCSRCSWCCWCSLWGCWAKHVVQVKGHCWHCRRRCCCADCRPSRCHRLHRGHARKRCCCCCCWWRCGRWA